MYYSLFLLFSGAFAWFAAVSTYRLLFHPLRHFPGPRLAALTNYYAAYYDIVKFGGFLKQIELLHAQYGPVVRVRPNALHFAEPQAFADIYTHGSSFVKSDLLYDTFVHETESSFGFKDPQKARQRRQLLSPLFSRRAIIQFRGIIQDKVDKLILRTKDYPDGGPINLAFGFRSLTMEIISSYCFATGYNTLEHPTFQHNLIVAWHGLLRRLWLMKYFTTLMRLSVATPVWVAKLINPSLVEQIRMTQDLEHHIGMYLEDETRLQDVEHETIFHRLILPENKDGVVDRSLRLSKKSLLHESLTLLSAGSDTVANTSCVGTFHALNDPSVIGRLKEELRKAWPDEDSAPDLSVLEQLPYLTAFIKESLRLSHGVPTPLSRTIGPSDAEIGGFHIPAGTEVEMSCVFMHKNPDIFQDPETFSPDRWMGPNAKELENYLVPFSKGPRMCLGINLAWCELYLIFGTIFRRLDLSLYDTTIDDFKEFGDIFVPIWRGKDLRVMNRAKV